MVNIYIIKVIDFLKKIKMYKLNFFKEFDILGSALSLRQRIDSFNMTKNLTNQRKEAEKASDVQFTSLDVKLILKRKIIINNIPIMII